MYPEIYSQDDGRLRVYADPGADQEIGIYASFTEEAEPNYQKAVWFEADQLPEFIGAITAAVGLNVAPAAGVVVNNSTSLASGTLNEKLLALAIEADLSVAFTYAKGEGQFLEERTLEPHEVREVKGNKLVLGYDVDRDDVRAYRLDRIKGRVALR